MFNRLIWLRFGGSSCWLIKLIIIKYVYPSFLTFANKEADDIVNLSPLIQLQFNMFSQLVSFSFEFLIIVKASWKLRRSWLSRSNHLVDLIEN